MIRHARVRWKFNPARPDRRERGEGPGGGAALLRGAVHDVVTDYIQWSLADLVEDPADVQPDHSNADDDEASDQQGQYRETGPPGEGGSNEPAIDQQSSEEEAAKSEDEAEV